MDGDFVDDEPAPATARRPKPRQSAPVSHPGGEGGSLLDPLLKNRAFQDMVRSTVLEVLRSPEGQKLLEQAVRHQLRSL